jgi:hypothetical protein
MLTNLKCDEGTYSLKLSLDHNSPTKRKLNVTIEPGTRKFGEPDMTGTKVLRAAFRADVSSGGNGGGRAVSGRSDKKRGTIPPVVFRRRYTHFDAGFCPRGVALGFWGLLMVVQKDGRLAREPRGWRAWV